MTGFASLSREFINKYDVDVFGHTWWSEEQVGQFYDTSITRGKYPIESNLPDKIDKAYNFSNIVFEHSKSFIPDKKYNVPPERNHNKWMDAIKSQYYSLQSSVRLCKEYEEENNLDYDWIIVTRYDIGISENFPNLILLDKNGIHVDNYHGNRKHIINTNFWLLGKKNKFIYENLYDDFDETYEGILNKKNMPNYSMIEGTELEVCDEVIGEPFMAFYLLFRNLLDKVVYNTEFRYNLVR